MKHFTCHPIRDGHSSQSATVGWMVVSSDNDGTFYTSGYLQIAKEKALKDHPQAKFSEAFGIWAEEQHILKQGPRAYIWWMKNGRPAELASDRPWL